MESSGSGAVLVSRCPRCSQTWKLPEPHGGICTKCFIEVVDSFEELGPSSLPASVPEASAVGAVEEPKEPIQAGTGVEEGGERQQSQLFQARVTRDIIVRSMVNGSTACTVRVSDDTCCSEVKKMIEENADIPLDQQRIFVGSRELLDDDVLGNATTYVEAIQVLRIDPRIEAAEKLAAELDVEGTSVDRRRKILEELSDLGDGAGFQAEKIAEQLQFKPERPGIQHFPVRAAALVALGAVGSNAAMPHLPEIEACIGRNPQTGRLTAICLIACQTLNKLGCATPAHAEMIVQMMEGPDKVAACKCLMALGPERAAPHVGLLAANLQDPDKKEMTGVALDALAQLGYEVSKPYIGDIVKFLLPHAVQCSRAVEVLNDFGCVAEIAVTLHSHFPGARLRACEILAERGSEIAAPYASTFVALLRDEFLPVRIAAFKALGSLGPLIQDPHLGIVVAYFVDEDPNIREAACDALVQLGAAEVLAQYLQHDDPAICRRACLALGCLGPAAVPHMAAIQKLCCNTGEVLVPGVGKVSLNAVANDVLDQLQNGN